MTTSPIVTVELEDFRNYIGSFTKKCMAFYDAKHTVQNVTDFTVGHI